MSDIRPLATPPSAPPDTPPKVAEAFLDGMDNLNRQRWNPAGGSFRRAIELGLLHFVRNLNSDSEPEFRRLRTLNDRIDWVANKGWIAPALQDWSHAVRLVGNEIHDEEGATEGEVKDVAILCEALLTYLFTLPKMIAKRQPKTPPPSP